MIIVIQVGLILCNNYVLTFLSNAGFVELPDGKVLSGSEWGNMLLWDGGLIKVEICKKGNKLCHNGMIEQFFMDEGELMSIGVDGFIKVLISLLFLSLEIR